MKFWENYHYVILNISCLLLTNTVSASVNFVRCFYKNFRHVKNTRNGYKSNQKHLGCFLTKGFGRAQSISEVFDIFRNNPKNQEKILNFFLSIHSVGFNVRSVQRTRSTIKDLFYINNSVFEHEHELKDLFVSLVKTIFGLAHL